MTFINNLGPLSLLLADDLDLKGTVASAWVSRMVVGVLPPFNGPDFGSQTITVSSKLSVIASPFKQGITYYFRVTAVNALGSGPAVMPQPPFKKPLPQPPSAPSEVSLTAKDGSTLTVDISTPAYDGGKDLESYRIVYSEKEFTNEKQRMSLSIMTTR